jgi:hypothetical protein
MPLPQKFPERVQWRKWTNKDVLLILQWGCSISKHLIGGSLRDLNPPSEDEGFERFAKIQETTRVCSGCERCQNVLKE